MKSQRIKSFMMGVITTILIGAMIAPVSAAAASAIKNIQVVIGGIKIYVDGNIQTPVDANGNKVEPLIYNGTTYLPVRAATNMLTDKEISWDQKSMSVYIGKQPIAESTPLDSIKPYVSHMNMRTGERAKYTILDETFTTFNMLYGRYNESNTYLLKSNYSSINGKYIIPYTRIGSTDKGKLEFYSVDEFGGEILIDSYELKAGDKAIDIKVNIVGVNILKIKMVNDYGAFYNITLTGI